MPTDPSSSSRAAGSLMLGGFAAVCCCMGAAQACRAKSDKKVRSVFVVGTSVVILFYQEPERFSPYWTS